MPRPAAVASVLLPAVAVTAALLIGLILEQAALPALARATRHTRWGEVVVRALRGVPLILSGLFGLYLATTVLPVDAVLLPLLRKALVVMAILLATIAAARAGGEGLRLYALRARGGFPVISIFTNLTRLTVFVLGGLIVLQAMGLSITPLLTALGVGGLAVALALQDTLANLFAGLYIIASRQVRPGDYVRLDSGEEGYVVDVTWRSTAIRERPDNLIIVPNARLASAIVTNYNQPAKEISVPVDVGVSYDSDLEHVERVTLEVAREVMRDVPGGVPDAAPTVRFQAFGDSSILLRIRLRMRTFEDQYPVRHVFLKRLHARYRGEGIEIPFPIRTIQVKPFGAAGGETDRATPFTRPASRPGSWSGSG